MKLTKAFFAVVLVLMFGATAMAQEKQQPNQTGGAPFLVIDSFTHDFGEVKAGTPLRFAFKVKNNGKADLLINSVSPG